MGHEISDEMVTAAARAMWDPQYEDGHWDEVGHASGEDHAGHCRNVAEIAPPPRGRTSRPRCGGDCSATRTPASPAPSTTTGCATRADRELWEASDHGWTFHGCTCCDLGPADDEHDAALCGGPRRCDDCRNEASEMHAAAGGER